MNGPLRTWRVTHDQIVLASGLCSLMIENTVGDYMTVTMTRAEEATNIVLDEAQLHELTTWLKDRV